MRLYKVMVQQSLLLWNNILLTNILLLLFFEHSQNSIFASNRSYENFYYNVWGYF